MGFVSRASLSAGAAARMAQTRRIKAALVPVLALGEDDALSVNEIACTHPDCPGAETVVLVMRAGEPTRAFRIGADAAAVSQADLAALAEDERRRRVGA